MQEIERKFLVHKAGAPWRALAFSVSHICQGYIKSEGATVRIRTKAISSLPSSQGEESKKAFRTIKGPSLDGGLSRYEFEKEITMDEAQHLLELCKGGVIDKTRYLVKSGNHTFEVDEFHGDNDGLIFAEVELGSADEAFEKPDFIADEVTGDKRYYNSNLLTYPYKEWNTNPTLLEGEGE